MDHYNPLHAPDPAEWLELDEQERIGLVADYHDEAGIDLPNVKVHATMHAIVENQIALGDETPVRLKARQLMAQGLDRHEAIHAIASVLIKHIYDITKKPQGVGDPNQGYYAALRRLNARKWLRSG
ncbi:hypothetical protein CCS01_21020 [Rhodopila globiformis]|uniref:DUF1841 domain-containing protein n=1 Tax=Rhodopila globiformis TaxID=1071 RepID=A0A2S6N513_RHOGL|nr:hypothetical protein CCS01_21020 [Rhodopila globiformis]